MAVLQGIGRQLGKAQGVAGFVRYLLRNGAAGALRGEVAADLTKAKLMVKP